MSLIYISINLFSFLNCWLFSSLSKFAGVAFNLSNVILCIRLALIKHNEINRNARILYRKYLLFVYITKIISNFILTTDIFQKKYYKYFFKIVFNSYLKTKHKINKYSLWKIKKN